MAQTLPHNERIENTRKALADNNINTIVANSGKEATDIVRRIIPSGAQVLTATSTTLDQMGLSTTINEGNNYKSVKKQLKSLDRDQHNHTMQQIGAAPEYVVGSVHAVTEDGKVIIASGSGSQLPSYAYGAPSVVWVVSTKKIVKNLDEGIERIYSHVLPLEDQRMKKVYGPESGSNVNKLLVINKELNPDRITLIFVKEDLGF